VKVAMKIMKTIIWVTISLSVLLIYAKPRDYSENEIDKMTDDILARLDNDVADGSKFLPKCYKDCSGIKKSPVCASDGRNYPNSCVMEIRACQMGTTLKVVKKGFCEVIPTVKKCDLHCGGFFLPICGSDGVTYNSKCEMEKKSCEQGIKITEYSNSPCQ